MNGGLVTLGEAMLALTAERIGPLRLGGTMTTSMAGSEATVAIAVRRLGHPATWISRVGDDEPGELILSRLRGEDVDLIVGRGPGPTGLLLKERPRAAVRRVHYYRAGSAATALTPVDIPPGVVEGAAVLHVSGITMAIGEAPARAVVEAVERASGAGILVTLDVNHRRKLWTDHDARAALGRILPQVGLVIAGLDEARLLLPDSGDDPAELAAGLLGLGPESAIVTLGAAGSVVAETVGVHHIPAVSATEIDPFGAGDAFVGGTIAGLLDGADLPAAARQGALVGALAVSCPGDWEGLPTRADLDAAAADRDIFR
jgi:2-dehydro-3-deoxygluconokinase